MLPFFSSRALGANVKPRQFTRIQPECDERSTCLLAVTGDARAQLLHHISDSLEGQLNADLSFYTRVVQRQRGPVLELGCGSGRILEALVPSGELLFGLDCSRSGLRRARKRLAGAGRQATFVQSDMMRVPGEFRFKLVILAQHVLGYLPNDHEVRGLFAQLRQVLEPGGRVALDLAPVEAWLAVDPNPPTNSWRDEEREADVLGNHSCRWSSSRGAFIYTKSYQLEFAGQRRWRVEEKTVMRTFSAESVVSLLKQLGYRNIEVYGSYSFENFQDGCPRLIVLAQR